MTREDTARQREDTGGQKEDTRRTQGGHKEDTRRTRDDTGGHRHGRTLGGHGRTRGPRKKCVHAHRPLIVRTPVWGKTCAARKK